jgi:hypothetical protein
MKASSNKESKKTLPSWVTQVRQQPQNVPFSLRRWLAAQGGAFSPAATAQSTDLQKSSGQRIAHAATATHRAKTARRRVTDIVDILLQYKKHILVIPTKRQKGQTKKKVGEESIK